MQEPETSCVFRRLLSMETIPRLEKTTSPTLLKGLLSADSGKDISDLIRRQEHLLAGLVDEAVEKGSWTRSYDPNGDRITAAAVASAARRQSTPPPERLYCLE
jgi:hypothetical protein